MSAFWIHRTEEALIHAWIIPIYVIGNKQVKHYKYCETLFTFFGLLFSSLLPCLSQCFSWGSLSSIPGEGSGELSEGKLTEITDNWHPLNMAHGTRTVYPGKQNKGSSSTFQPPEEGQSIHLCNHIYHNVLPRAYIFFTIFITMFWLGKCEFNTWWRQWRTFRGKINRR